MDSRAALERLLEESASLRQRSEALAAEVEELRQRIAEDGKAAKTPVERRRKPRQRGK
jgi:hypothetical protein